MKPRRPRTAALVRLALGAGIACQAACGSDGTGSTGVGAGATLRLAITGLGALGPGAGRYEAWVVNRAGAATSLGTWTTLDGGSVTATVPAADADAVMVTWEAATDVNPAPSTHVILRGTLRGGAADLSVVGAVTQANVELHRAPGQFTMFSPSDNAKHGYPSFEESGVWLFNMAPRQLPQNDMWVRLGQLQPGWVYEGWMVRDLGQSGAIWLSYGKFLPDATGAINTRDDTGWGPFSGVLDYKTAGEEEFPGDDWISNPLNLPFPAGLSLPLNLREKTVTGALRWTHAITVEPSSDRGEAVSAERPFVIRPYRDLFGEGEPGIPRTINFRPDGVPAGRVTVQ